MSITTERFNEIFEGDSKLDGGDNAFAGLQIIAKYINPKEKELIRGAGHDVIYSVDVDDLIDAGITEVDAIALRTSNWMIQHDGLACFV